MELLNQSIQLPVWVVFALTTTLVTALVWGVTSHFHWKSVYVGTEAGLSEDIAHWRHLALQLLDKKGEEDLDPESEMPLRDLEELFRHRLEEQLEELSSEEVGVLLHLKLHSIAPLDEDIVPYVYAALEELHLATRAPGQSIVVLTRLGAAVAEVEMDRAANGSRRGYTPHFNQDLVEALTTVTKPYPNTSVSSQ